MEVRSPRSLDLPIGEDGDEGFNGIVGSIDPSLELVEEIVDVRAALSRLPKREQEILLMRF
jgi:DNA-directed RNA polymerase specialized sigma24 family protein